VSDGKPNNIPAAVGRGLPYSFPSCSLLPFAMPRFSLLAAATIIATLA
jgi:hypothetical protein